MNATKEILQAIKDKDLKSILIIDRQEIGQVIRFCFDRKDKFSDNIHLEVFDHPAEIFYSDYTYLTSGESAVNIRPGFNVCFHLDMWRGGHLDSHIITFFDYIRKDSDIKFHVVINNNCDVYKRLDINCHQLKGCIIGKTETKVFLLDSFVGLQNSASPVQW